MSRERQIEEMARDLCECYNCDGTCYQDDKPCDFKCDEYTNAQYLYEKGYRKVVEQSETARECKEGVDNGFSSSVTESATRAEVARVIFEEIDEIFERQIYESRWLDQNGKVLGVVDVFYAFECWRDYIKPELKKKYTEVAERRKGVENSPVDCSTSSVTDSKGDTK